MQARDHQPARSAPVTSRATRSRTRSPVAELDLRIRQRVGVPVRMPVGARHGGHDRVHPAVRDPHERRLAQLPVRAPTVVSSTTCRPRSPVPVRSRCSTSSRTQSMVLGSDSPTNAMPRSLPPVPGAGPPDRALRIWRRGPVVVTFPGLRGDPIREVDHARDRRPPTYGARPALTDLPVRDPGPGELLVEVHAPPRSTGSTWRCSSGWVRASSWSTGSRSCRARTSRGRWRRSGKACPGSPPGTTSSAW